MTLVLPNDRHRQNIYWVHQVLTISILSANDYTHYTVGSMVCHRQVLKVKVTNVKHVRIHVFSLVLERCYRVKSRSRGARSKLVGQEQIFVGQVEML